MQKISGGVVLPINEKTEFGNRKSSYLIEQFPVQNATRYSAQAAWRKNSTSNLLYLTHHYLASFWNTSGQVYFDVYVFTSTIEFTLSLLFTFFQNKILFRKEKRYD